MKYILFFLLELLFIVITISIFYVLPKADFISRPIFNYFLLGFSILYWFYLTAKDVSQTKANDAQSFLISKQYVFYLITIILLHAFVLSLLIFGTIAKGAL